MKKRSLRALAVLLCAAMMLAVMPALPLSAAPTLISGVTVRQPAPTGGYTPDEYIDAQISLHFGYSVSHSWTVDYYKSTADTPSLDDPDSWEPVDRYSRFAPGETYAAHYTVRLYDDAYAFDPAVAAASDTAAEVRVLDVTDDAFEFAFLFAPATGFAADSYLVAVGDTDVTPANAADVLGDGTAKFDPETRTLTLDGATVNTVFSVTPSARSGILSRGDLTIVLKGNNVIDLSALDATVDTSAGIYAEDGCLSVTGDGDLTVSGGDAAQNSYALVSDDDLFLRFGGTLSLNAGPASATSTAVHATRGLAVEATRTGAVLSASGRYQALYGGAFYASDFAVKATYTYGGFLNDIAWTTFKPNFNAYSTVRLTRTEVTDYTLSVAGVPVTDANKNNILGDGTAKFDPETRTLTLNSARLAYAATYTSAYFSGTNYAVIYAAEPLTINLVGDNVIDASSFTYGPANTASSIVCDGARLSIAGDGNLTINDSKPAVTQYAIWGLKNVDITMPGDLTVTGAKDEVAFGIYSNGGTLNMDMSGNWSIDIAETGSGYPATGLAAYRGVTLRNSGTGRIASGLRGGSDFYGICVEYGDLNVVNTGDLSVTVGDVNAASTRGLIVHGGFDLVNDGTMTVTTGDADQDSYAIECDGGFDLVNNGTLTLSAGDADDSEAIAAADLIRLTGRGTADLTTGDGRYTSALYGADDGAVVFGGSGTYRLTSGTANGWSSTVYGGTIRIEDAAAVSVTAKKNAAGNLQGIQAGKSLTVTTSGDVDVTVGKTDGWAVGLNGAERLSLLGAGNVTATVGKGDAGTNGLYADEVVVDGPGNLRVIADADAAYSVGIDAGVISFAGTNLDNTIYVEGGTSAFASLPAFDPDFYAVKASIALPAALTAVGLNVTNYDTFKAVELTSLVKTVDDTVYGDANADGDVDMKDVLLVRKFIAGLVGETALNLVNADANADGSVDMKDVLLIRKYIAGLVSKLGA